MILVHCFLRTIKRKTYLMADSSAAKGCNPLWDTPEILFEVDPLEDPTLWIDRTTKKITESFPELEIMKVLKPRKRKGSLQVFDITFNKKVKK